jgi:hypothetical protein
LGARQGGQEHSRQYRDDRDDDEKFDQSERAPGLEATSPVGRAFESGLAGGEPHYGFGGLM